MAGESSRINGRLGGRPRGSENEETQMRRAMRQRWLERVYEKTDELIDAHLDLALGHRVQESTTEGSKRIYERSPNRQSIEWAMEQVFGKAAQTVTIEEPRTDGLFTEMSDEEMKQIDFEMRCALGEEISNTDILEQIKLASSTMVNPPANFLQQIKDLEKFAAEKLGIVVPST